MGTSSWPPFMAYKAAIDDKKSRFPGGEGGGGRGQICL